MEFTAHDLWSKVLTGAREKLPEQSFRTWLVECRALALSDSELLIEAANHFHAQWIEDKYAPLLTDLIRQALGRPLSLRVQIAQSAPAAAPIPSIRIGEPEHPTSPPTARAGSRGELNQRYTFDRYVVGSNNQLAAAACRAVAELPGRTYNPLFLYGGVGLGKTHLMHAIGNALLDSDDTRRVAYVPSERFTNELVTSIQAGTTAAFRRRYRRMDLLLVDDVHFLAGKERTQEEFFHTFNALYDAQKQIILTSDRPPKENTGLESRLVSRFEWGLVADIKPPDYETRVAILRKKADYDQLVLDDEVIDFIARSCTDSVRELEGAVIKLLAYSSLTNAEMTIELARTALAGIIRGQGLEHGLTPEGIKESVATEFGVRFDALASKRRTKDLTVPRQVAMYLIKEMLGMPLVGIGKEFGGRDHSTVIHSIRKVEEDMTRHEDFQERVEGLRVSLAERM